MITLFFPLATKFLDMPRTLSQSLSHKENPVGLLPGVLMIINTFSCVLANSKVSASRSGKLNSKASSNKGYVTNSLPLSAQICL